MSWIQVYDPLGQPLLSAAVAAAPIVVLLGLLLRGTSAPRAASAGLATALAVAMFVFQMPACRGAGRCRLWRLLRADAHRLDRPARRLSLSSDGPHRASSRSLKRSVAAISPDRRMQALLIAFCFGTLLEGAAGFGAPVAISVGIADRRRASRRSTAAGLCLLANTSPVAFGSLGIPIMTLGASFGAAGDGVKPDGRTAADALFSLLIPGLAGGHHVGLEGAQGLLAGGRGLRRRLFRDRSSSCRTIMARPWYAWWAGSRSMGSLVLLLRFWQPQARFGGSPEKACGNQLSLAPRARRQIALRLDALAAAGGHGLSLGLADVEQPSEGRAARAAQCPGRHQPACQSRCLAWTTRVSHGAGRRGSRRRRPCRRTRRGRV